MKIAMIGHKRIPSRLGGIEIVVDRLATRMVKNNDVTVYNRYTGGKKLTDYNGIRIKEIRTFKKQSLNAVVYSFFATICACFHKYDVIHFHAEGPCSMIPIAKLFGKHCIATIHGLDWQRAKWGGFATKYLLFGERQAAKYADEVIVLSENMKKYFKEKYNRKTVFIPNGTDEVNPEPAELIKSEYGLNKNNYILFLARITPEKKLDMLIDAYKKIQTDIPLVIAGDISSNTEYISQIKEKAADDKRIILTGFVQGKMLAELFSNCLVYVLPSDIEGMPMSLLEAISFHARVLVSSIPENTEVVSDYGLVFEKGNIDDLEKKLNYIIDNKDKYDTDFGVYANKEETDKKINDIINNYSWDMVTQKTLELYKKR